MQDTEVTILLIESIGVTDGTLREALATEAEALSDSTSWKSTSERYSAMVEEWKALPRSDRSLEQDLWKRLSSARASFDKRRRAHFAHRLADVVFGNAPASRHLPEHVAEFFA